MDGRQGSRWVQIVWALGCVLLVAVACRDDVGVTLDTNPPGGCDSVVCVPDSVPGDTVYRDTGRVVFDTVLVFDTVVVTVVDSVYIWCIRIKRGHGDDPDIFECDNGYRGPLF